MHFFGFVLNAVYLHQEYIMNLLMIRILNMFLQIQCWSHTYKTTWSMAFTIGHSQVCILGSITCCLLLLTLNCHLLLSITLLLFINFLSQFWRTHTQLLSYSQLFSMFQLKFKEWKNSKKKFYLIEVQLLLVIYWNWPQIWRV